MVNALQWIPGSEMSSIGENTMSRRTVIVVAIAAAIIAIVVILVGSIVLEEAATSTVNVALENAESVTATIDLPFNDLSIAGGAMALVEGTVNFALPNHAPRVTYTVEDETGHLVISQPVLSSAQDATGVQPSILRFNDTVPTALDVRRRDGSTTLDLSPLSLMVVSANLGSGSDLLTLAGLHPITTDLTVNSGGGSDTLTIACECSSLLHTAIITGSNTDQIDLSGEYPVLADLRVDSGSDDDLVTIDGQFPTLQTASIQLGAGNDSLMLNGTFNSALNMVVNIGTGDDIVTLGPDWTQDNQITLISEGDTTSLIVPDEIGVRVEIASRSNTVDAQGLTEADGAWENSAYASSAVRLQVNINTTPNEVITLRTASQAGG